MESELRPGVSTGAPRRPGRGATSDGRGDPVVQGLPRGQSQPARSRPASASRSTKRSSTGSRAIGSSARARSCPSMPARSSTAGMAMPPGRSSSGRRRPRSASSSTRPAVAAMMAGIAAAVPGNHIEDISAAVEDVARPAGFGVVRQFVGHGIGTAMHEEPQVPNYRTGRPGRRLEPGLCLAIEPMFTLGRARAAILARRLDGRDQRSARWPPTSSTPSP